MKVRVGVLVDAIGATSCAGRPLSHEGRSSALVSGCHCIPIGVSSGVAVDVAVKVGDSVSVGVSVVVAEAAPVKVGDNVAVAVSVDVAVAIPVWVCVSVWVGAGVRLPLCVAVAVPVNVAVGALLAGSDRFSTTCWRLPAPSYWYSLVIT